MSERYREAASVLLLRPSEGSGDADYQLLLLRKPRKNDAWQLPQGGIEAGETVAEAAMRELQEEAGLKHAQLLGESERVYSYDFPSSYRRFRPDEVCGQRIRFVFALAGDAEVVVDQNEIDAFVWIDLAELSTYVQRAEYQELVQALFKEAVAAVRKIS